MRTKKLSDLIDKLLHKALFYYLYFLDIYQIFEKKCSLKIISKEIKLVGLR